MKKRLPLVITAIMVCTLTFCTDDASHGVREYYTLEPDSVVTIDYSGELESMNNSVVYTPSEWNTTYRITFLVPEGSSVQEGDTVVRFDPQESLTRMEQVQATLEMQQAKLNETLERNAISMKEKINARRQLELQFQINKSKLEQARFESEVNRKKTELELEKSRLSLQKAGADIEAQEILNNKNENLARLEISQAQVALERARRSLADMFLVAPKGGMVVYQRQGWGSDESKVREGDTVWPRSGILAIPDLGKMRVIIRLNEVDRPFVTEGQQTFLRVEAYPDTVFTGTVDDVSKIVNWNDDANNLKTYDVSISIHSGQNYRLKPGLSAMVTLAVGSVGPSLRIPSFCLFEEDGRFFVRTQKDKNLEVSVVTIRDGVAFIAGNGLEAGLQVINNPEIPLF